MCSVAALLRRASLTLAPLFVAPPPLLPPFFVSLVVLTAREEREKRGERKHLEEEVGKEEVEASAHTHTHTSWCHTACGRAHSQLLQLL